jgi:hypothetical protein
VVAEALPRHSAIALARLKALYFYEYNDIARDQESKGDRIQVKIRSQRLTTCRVASDGSNVGLEFLDHSGAAVTLELPFEQAEAIVMTLPHLLARAIRHKTGDDSARYVFHLQGWSIESTKNQDCLITTLATTDGFEVCFGIPLEAGRSLAMSLLSSVDQTTEAGESLAIQPEGIADREKFN